MILNFPILYKLYVDGVSGKSFPILNYNNVDLRHIFDSMEDAHATFNMVCKFEWDPIALRGVINIFEEDRPTYAYQLPITSEKEARKLGAIFLEPLELFLNPEQVQLEYQNRDDIHYASRYVPSVEELLADDKSETKLKLLEQELSDENYELSKPEEYRLVDRYFCFIKNNAFSEEVILPENEEKIVSRTKVFRHCPGEIVNYKQKTQVELIPLEEQNCIEAEAASQPKAHDWANRYRLEHLSGWHYENGKLIPKDNIFFYTASVRGKILTVGKVMVCFAKMDEETDLLIFLQNLSEKDGEVYRFLFLIEPGSDAWDEIIGNENQVIDEQRIVGWEYNSNSGNLER